MSRLKRITEFTQTVQDLLDSGLQDVTARVIELDAQPLMLGEQLLQRDTSLVGSTGITIDYPLEHDTEADDFVEGDDVPAADPEIAYAFTQSTPADFGVSDVIRKQHILAASWNAVSQTQKALARAMAQKSDSKVWEGIANAKTIVGETLGTAVAGWGTVAGKENYFDTHPTVPTYEGKILEVLSVNDVGGLGVFTAGAAVNGYTYDAFVGIFNLTDLPTGTLTVSYVYSDHILADNPNTDYANLNYYQVFTDADYGYADVVQQQYQIIGRNGMPDTIVLDNLAANLLTLDDKFIDASDVADKTVMNGLIGQIATMNVLMTQQLWPGLVAALKKLDIGYKVWKERMNSRREFVQRKAGDVWIGVWQSSSIAIVKASFISLAFNAAPFTETNAAT